MRDASTFKALRTTRRRARSGPLWVAWVPGSSDEPPKVAFAIGRRVGNAVNRNRLRRQLRAAVAESCPRSGSYLVGAGAGATTLPYDELKALMSKALNALFRSEDL